MSTQGATTYSQAVLACINWIEREMLPAPDGAQGVWERYRINVDGKSYCVRPDCTLEVARSVALAADHWGSRHPGAHHRSLAINLADAALALQRPDGSFPFFRRVPPPGEADEPDADELAEMTYPNDNGKIGRALLWLWRWSAEDRYRAALVRLLDFLAQAQDSAGVFPTHPGMEVAVPCMVVWPTLALLAGGVALNFAPYLTGARRGLDWLQAQILPSGRICTSYELAGIEGWRPASSETAMALKLFAIARRLLDDESYAEPLAALGGYLLGLQDRASGAIGNRDTHSAGASQQDDPTLTDLVYTDGYALIALQEAYRATGEARYLEGSVRLADFLTQVQCHGESPRWDGGWRGSLDARSGTPRGRADQDNPLDEGGLYSVYTGWCAAPNTYALLRQMELAGT